MSLAWFQYESSVAYRGGSVGHGSPLWAQFFFHSPNCIAMSEKAGCSFVCTCHWNEWWQDCTPESGLGNRIAQFAQMFLQPMHTSRLLSTCNVLSFALPNYVSVFRVIRLLLIAPSCCQHFVIVHHSLKLKNFPYRTVLFFQSVRVTVTALETEQMRWKSYWQRLDLGTYPTLVILIVKIIRNNPHHICNCRTLIQEPQVH